MLELVVVFGEAKRSRQRQQQIPGTARGGSETWREVGRHAGGRALACGSTSAPPGASIRFLCLFSPGCIPGYN